MFSRLAHADNITAVNATLAVKNICLFTTLSSTNLFAQFSPTCGYQLPVAAIVLKFKLETVSIGTDAEYAVIRAGHGHGH